MLVANDLEALQFVHDRKVGLVFGKEGDEAALNIIFSGSQRQVFEQDGFTRVVVTTRRSSSELTIFFVSSIVISFILVIVSTVSVSRTFS
jgi:hypothetical protein